MKNTKLIIHQHTAINQSNRGYKQDMKNKFVIRNSVQQKVINAHNIQHTSNHITYNHSKHLSNHTAMP